MISLGAENRSLLRNTGVLRGPGVSCGDISHVLEELYLG